MVKKLFLATLGVLLVFVAAVAAVVVRPTGAPDYAGAPPALWDEGHVVYTTSQVVDMSLEDLRVWQRDNELVSFLQPSGSIPGVESTTMLEGEWFTPGAKRRVNLEGGHSAVERVLEATPELFSYQVWGFTTPARFLVDHARGEIVYTPEGEDRTRVTWTYLMAPRAFFTRPPLERFMTNEFGPFMDSGLARMAQAAGTASVAAQD